MTFTKEELAIYNGKDGRPAYVCVYGTIYDVSHINIWQGGSHFGAKAGTDVSEYFSLCHKECCDVLDKLRIIGVLSE